VKELRLGFHRAYVEPNTVPGSKSMTVSAQGDTIGDVLTDYDASRGFGLMRFLGPSSPPCLRRWAANAETLVPVANPTSLA
jgi:hypothetical protein